MPLLTEMTDEVTLLTALAEVAAKMMAEVTDVVPLEMADVVALEMMAEMTDVVAAGVADEMPDKMTDVVPLLTELADEMTALLKAVAHHLLLYTGRDQCGGAAGTLILLIKIEGRLKIIQRPKNGKEMIELPLVNGCDCLPQHQQQYHPHPRELHQRQ